MYLNGITPEQYEEAEKVAEALIAELNPLVLGQRREGFSCTCGAIHCPTAVATKIEPAGPRYPEQILCTWSVQMTPPGHTRHAWSTSISGVLPRATYESTVKPLVEKHVRPFMEKHFPAILADAQARYPDIMWYL